MSKLRLETFAACLAYLALGCGGGNGATSNGLGGNGPDGNASGNSHSGGTGAGASAGASTRTPAAGTSAGRAGIVSDGGGASSVTCAEPSTTPDGTPALTVGVWTNISPKDVPFGDAFTQGMAIDPCDTATLYLTVCSFDVEGNKAGLYKSTDAGATWKRISLLDEPIRVRIDPRDSRHLYAVDGVRGGTQGFFVSVDGGETFQQPEEFKNLKASADLFQYDTYDVAVDPSDFAHVLVSHHSAWGWTDTKWDTSSGVLESKDGGTSWVVHEPLAGWGSGHAINFLYDPALGLGNSDTWLLGTQGAGMFRTEDAGKTWTKVSDLGIQHGGGSVYYDKAGILYASGANGNLRSADNGLTWTKLSEGKGYNAVFGDGQLLYTAPGFGPTSYFTSAEGEGTTWTPFNTTQLFDSGPFEMALDRTHGILYSANWGDGLWALKLAP
jgi:photosystem II stability/assembly factor-like uncharacterized protein